ncbi:MAG: hypothetical protein ACHQHO_10630 [Solirubrobacterales bacterium]
MTRHRTIILIVGWLVAFGTASSDAALASSLLSGYGGPGQGNQAILGSALLNRPGGGSGSSGSGSGDSSSLASSPGGSTTSSEAAASSGTGSTTRSAAGHEASGAQASGAHGGSQAHRSATRPASPPGIADVYAAAERNRSAPSTPALGLSGVDLLLIVLVLGMLALIGVLSRRLTRAPAPVSSRGAGGGG